MPIPGYALKNFADVRGKAARSEGDPLRDVPASPGNLQGAAMPEQLPEAGRVRQGWTRFQPTFRELPGVISARALQQHMIIYQGYLDRAKVLESASAFDKWQGHETEAVAGACMHELFFQGLTGMPAAPSPTVQNALIERFGSIDGWWLEMCAAGEVAKGWAVLGICSRDDNDLAVFALNAHDRMPVGYLPVCVADAYEHAYFMDHGTNKRAYLEGMLRFIEWQALDERYVHATR